ncbi:Morn repeat domain containing protein [Pandoravirus salinus]|uniref:MORN repeat-containing protein 3 n=1 Tax=Pandoravirus salinus TaxID=1349410 RepID=S4VVV8_9VIRU|nr:morn repeat domain [Pandoravirus salinus]AGO84789.2 Morn repeat domain containing protein [Pandoravirus salinus]
MKGIAVVGQGCGGADKASVDATKPSENHCQSRDPLASGTAFFDLLPDELVLAILQVLGDLSALASWSQTSRRHHALASDPVVWRHLCESRFGSLLHHDFAKFGKCWRWLYRAQARPAATTGVDVGALVLHTDEDDSIYWGDCRDGQPHGYGLSLSLPTRHCDSAHSLVRLWAGPADASTPIDASLEGEWCDGRAHGRAVATWPDGAQHIGTWAHGARNGHAVFTYPTGERHEGEWKDNVRHGHGVFIWHDGQCHVGLWADDARNGPGRCTHSNGDCYDGNWKDDVRHGNGIYTWPDGQRHVGLWASNVCNGYGVRTYPSGGRYEGNWKNDKRDRYGIYTYSDGCQYVGQHKDDRANGKGLLCKPNGARYTGDWVDDKRHGRGIHVKADGTRYDGQWQHDKKSGDGICDYADGSRVQGVWNYGVLVSHQAISCHRAGAPSCDRDSPCQACTAAHTI